MQTVRKRIYLSGPMRGVPERNYPLFNEVAKKLRDAGHTVYNPAEYPWEDSPEVMRMAFAAYCSFICLEATTIYMLPGWKLSTGATTEHKLATCLGLEVILHGLEQS